ncbi:Alpha/Beta hydrolase protein [Penicillium malachiteum]|uniref:Alpha/Beta hydrolase protein n=1 Tax=Penicillium malachiteum TaxID=1324776 RepID=A0AAD6MU44_9EURO|nr:Alpha/Beta hydrolase protein [Penicillium malachiteum]
MVTKDASKVKILSLPTLYPAVQARAYDSFVQHQHSSDKNRAIQKFDNVLLFTHMPSHEDDDRLRNHLGVDSSIEMSLVSTTVPSRAFIYFYTTYTLVTAPVWLAAAAIYYIPRFLRPNPAWSWKRAFHCSFANAAMKYWTTVQQLWPKPLEAGSLGNRFIVLNPQKSITRKTENGQENIEEVYKGITRSVPGVEPLPVGGIWFPQAPAETPRRLIIHFYRSAYVMFGSRPGETCDVGIEELSKVSGWPALSVQYRLSRDKKTTFPAALQDGITAYVYALEVLKISPSQIAFAGDWAGGNLAMALLRYLKEEDTALPLPRCVVLSSPWVDMTAKAIADAPLNRNYNIDYVKQDFMAWGATAFIPTGWDGNNPWFTILGNELQLGIPVFIGTGTSELLYDDILKFATNLREKVNDVEVLETLHSCHIPYQLGKEWDQEEDQAICMAAITKFLERTGK